MIYGVGQLKKPQRALRHRDSDLSGIGAGLMVEYLKGRLTYCFTTLCPLRASAVEILFHIH